ncbi:MAG: hypothetical protein R3245_03310, partial [Kiloniellales bacterium]|nr:hypothetical protein [Kiloniellales bacterium]
MGEAGVLYRKSGSSSKAPREALVVEKFEDSSEGPADVSLDSDQKNSHLKKTGSCDSKKPLNGHDPKVEELFLGGELLRDE